MTPSRAATHEFLADEEWEAWNAVLLLSRQVLGELDARLREEHRLGVTEFDVLITLFNADDVRLRMSDLADQVMLSPAGTTHLVTRLERDGLVRRVADPADGRKWFTVLTGAGETALREARGTHNEVVRRLFVEATTETDRRTLRRVWRRMSAAQS